MVYETFLTSVLQQLEAKLGNDYHCSIHPLPKNNGVTLDGLMICGPDFLMAPTIYLNSYYEQYQRGMTLEAILADIISLYQSTPPPNCLDDTDLAQFEDLKSKVMFRIIHTASNQTLLSDVPSLPMLDLSIVFYLFLDRNESGQMTALVHNDHMARWNVTAKDLWKLARKNTPREYPAVIQSMSDMMREIAKANSDDSYDGDLIDALLEDESSVSPLYVLSNQSGIYGAGCILYQDILKNFADSLGRDLIILPSSIHEVLITPDSNETSYEDLSYMVTCINRQEVPMEDQLSNQVYLYTRADDQIHIVSSAATTVGAASCH